MEKAYIVKQFLIIGRYPIDGLLKETQTIITPHVSISYIPAIIYIPRLNLSGCLMSFNNFLYYIPYKAYIMQSYIPAIFSIPRSIFV